MLSSTETLLDVLCRPLLTAPKPEPVGETLPSARELSLSIDRLRSLLEYDSQTGLLRWRYRNDVPTVWNVRYAGEIAGTITTSGAIQIRIELGPGRPALFRAHRIAWAIHYGEWPAHIVDHEDGNPANNRLKNLRKATQGQNNANRHIVTGASRFKGVYFHAARGKWAAQIKVNRTWEWLKLHDNEEDAARAYDIAAISKFGEFAKTNAALGLFN